MPEFSLEVRSTWLIPSSLTDTTSSPLLAGHRIEVEHLGKKRILATAVRRDGAVPRRTRLHAMRDCHLSAEASLLLTRASAYPPSPGSSTNPTRTRSHDTRRVWSCLASHLCSGHLWPQYASAVRAVSTPIRQTVPAAILKCARCLHMSKER